MATCTFVVGVDRPRPLTTVVRTTGLNGDPAKASLEVRGSEGGAVTAEWALGSIRSAATSHVALTIAGQPHTMMLTDTTVALQGPDDEPGASVTLTSAEESTLNELQALVTLVFAPPDGSETPPFRLDLTTADDEGFLSTVGDAATVGTGVGAMIGVGIGLFGGPIGVVAGGTGGAAIGAGFGAAVGIAMYLGQSD